MDTKPSPVNVEHDPAIKKKKKPQQRKLFVKVIDKVVTEPIKQSTNDNEDTTPSSSKITSSNNPNNSKLSKNTSTLVPSNQIKKEERRKKFATSNHQQNGAFTSKLSSPTIINQVENKQQYVSQENPPKQLLENNLKKKKNKKAKLVQQPKLKQQENAAQNSSTIQPQQQKTTRVVKQDSNEKLKNLIDTKIVQALNVLKEKEEEINKSKHHLVKTFDYQKYLEKVQILINDLKMIENQCKTFSARMKLILQSTTSMVQKLKATEIECGRITTNRLPIYSIRNEILELLDQNDVVICSCSTGAGKSTQIPQYLLEHGYKSIACTQPRKLTCITLANRVSEELRDKSIVSCKLGEKRKRNNRVSINFVTDRCLLNEYQNDQLLLSYSIIIVDEAHERSIYTDILLSLLKDCVKRRRALNNPLKVLISSATINEDLFSMFFDNCPIKKLEHQSYPVVEYFSHSREANTCEQATRKVTDIVKNNLHEGDILVFLASREDVTKCCKMAKKSLGTSCQIIALHGKIDSFELKKIFDQSKSMRKIIFSTNVAETSITIPSLRIVIDSGLMRQKFYDNDRNMSILKTVSISQSCALQRKGRVGRNSSGICYRLYPQVEYQRMKLASEAEIMRSHLGISILQILSCGVTDINAFELLEMPSIERITKEVGSLEKLGFVHEGVITEFGTMACELQTEPTLSRMIIQANLKGVADLMVIIVSMMSISDILFKKSQAKLLSKSLFHNDGGDLFSLLQIFQEYSQQSNKEEWSLKNNINVQYLKNAEMNLKDFKNKINFFKKKRIIRKECISKEQLLKESIIESQYQNLAYFDGYLPNMTKVYYIPSLKQRAFIHNSSHQFLGDPKPFILFSDLVRTDKLYMRNITPIDLKEILHFYPQLETNMIVSKVKEELRVKLPSIVSEDLKFRNTEFIEEVERQLGHVIEIDSTDSSIKVYCDQGERFNIISQIKEVIEIAKKRALSQILELEIENGLDDDSSGLRIMVSSGCKVKGLIFPNEFTKLQVDNLPLGCDDDTLRNLFLPYHTLDARVYSSLPNDSFASGYVVFTNFSVATTVYHKFKETYKLTPVLFNTKSSNESALVRLKWNIGPNNGYCLIGFKNGNNSATINNITHDRIFSSQLGPAGLRFQIKKTKNKDTLEIRNIYDHIDAKFVKVLLDNRHIDYHFVSILRRPVVVENDLIQGVLLSKVQSFQSLEFLDILNIDTYKQFGEALVCFTDQKDAKSAAQALNSTKFMGAILWANSIHRDSVTVPTEVTELLKFELQCLIDNCKAKIKYNTSRKNAENYKTEISIQSANLEDFNEAKKNVVALVKPLSLHLTHQTIQYASRKRKQLDQIENRNQVFISINSKTRTIEIFGLIDDKHNAKEEIMQLVEGHSKTLTIHLKYLKSITGNAGKPFQELKTQFANCDISLNVKTKELIVDGNEKDQHAIQQYVTELMENYEQNHNVEHTDDDCPICFERMTNPFRTIGCNHEICKDCFRFQIQNPNSFVCSCCEMDLSISEILMYLETKQEKTYTKALEDFLLENPESYKYCPKNCGSVCRIDGSDIICQTCNLSFCKECEKKSHKGQKCGDEDKTREWMNTKTKPCPSCSQRIEKSEGCNHMTCCYCGQHFCWLCLKGFATGQATYAHFRAGSCLTFDVPPEIIRPRQVNPPVNNQIPLQLIPQPNPQPVPARIRPLIIPPQPQQLQQPQPNNPQPQPPQRQGLLNCLVM